MAELADELALARDLAAQAGALTLEYFGRGIEVEWKADETPVTAADRAAEALIREGIERRFPEDGILGEEHGSREGSSGRRWIIDPIDGTQSFVRGVPFYGTLIGLEIGSEVPLGVMSLPALKTMLWAVLGQGAFRDGQQLQVSSVAKLADATLLTTDARPEFYGDKADGFARVLSECARQRGWGDCYGYALVASGEAEVMLDPVLSPWDCAPLVAILAEAGGSFSDWSGRPTIRGGSGVGVNASLRAAVLGALQD